MALFFAVIFILGLLFGSLTTVLTERWHKKKGGILFGRSECPKCRHTLAYFELIPLFSYLFQRGKCRHCHAHISGYYPLSEFMMAIGFTIISYSYWYNFGAIFSTSHIMLLFLSFVTVLYVLYDLRYKEIPDQIMVPALFGYSILLIGSLFFEKITLVFFDYGTYPTGVAGFVGDHLISAWILYSFFYLQILIPGGWYLAKRGKMKDLIQLIIGYILFPFQLIFSAFKKHEEGPEEDIPTWVGGGDLRVALFIGITLGCIHGISSFCFAYIFGSIYGITYLLLKRGKISPNHQIPFGPFLGLGWFMSILFYDQILVYAGYYIEALNELINLINVL